MPTPSKIDPHELDRLLGERKTTGEIAAHFGCTPGAVSQAKRRLGVAVAQSVAVQEVREAPLIVAKRQDAMGRLMDLVGQCEAQLGWIEQHVTPAENGDYREWQDQIIKFTAETRKLFSAMADIRYKLYRAETVERALLIMFEEIGRESPECQKRIRDRLQQASIPFFVDD